MNLWVRNKFLVRTRLLKSPWDRAQYEKRISDGSLRISHMYWLGRGGWASKRGRKRTFTERRKPWACCTFNPKEERECFKKKWVVNCAERCWKIKSAKYLPRARASGGECSEKMASSSPPFCNVLACRSPEPMFVGAAGRWAQGRWASTLTLLSLARGNRHGNVFPKEWVRAGEPKMESPGQE